MTTKTFLWEYAKHSLYQGERNFIMQVVCEATQSDYPDLQVVAFQCLVRIMQTYYDKMRVYMEKALFGVSKKTYIYIFIHILI